MNGQCNWCDKTHGTQRCDGCDDLFNWCQEHQVLDWRQHDVSRKPSSSALVGPSMQEVSSNNGSSEQHMGMNLAATDLDQVAVKDGTQRTIVTR